MKLRKNIIVSFVILVCCTFLFEYAFDRPTVINRYIATHVYGAPANSAFADDNFYKCVVDNYNSQFKTSIAYSESLTDNQLASMSYLFCHSYDNEPIDIKNTSGLEKLINVKIIDLYGNSISEIDLSKNIELKYLTLGDTYSSLKNIDLSNNTEIIGLSLNGIAPDTLDLSKLINLRELYLGKWMKKWGINGSTIATNHYFNNLSSINLEKNINLQILHIDNNNLSNIDLSNNLKLEELDISNNNIVNIDLSNNLNLKKLYLTNNNLTSINLAKNEKLLDLKLDSNMLETIILNDFIDISSISTILGTQNSNQDYIDLGNNKKVIPEDNFQFKINTRVVIPQKMTIEDFISNLGIHGLNYELYNKNNEEIIDYVDDGYILKILDGTILLQELDVQILPNSSFKDINFYRCLVDSFNSSNNTNVLYTDKLTDEQLQTITNVDCKYTYDTNNTINSSYGIEKLTSLIELKMRGQNLFSIDLSKNLNLAKLDLYSNNLTNIDLSNNTELIDIDLSWNDFSYIDLSNNKKLKTIRIDNIKKLKNLDLSNNTELTFLWLPFNNIEVIDLTKNPKLEQLYLHDNNIIDIDLSNNILLTNINLSDNNLKDLNLSNNVKLKELNLSNNNLNIINLNENIELSNLWLSSNNLKYLNLTTNEKLQLLNFYDNISETRYLINKNTYEFPAADNIFVGLPYNYKSILNEIYSNSIEIANDNNLITIDDFGTYEVIVEYTYADIPKVYYDITYKIVSIGLTSEKYEINDEKGYIYTKLDTEEETIINNIEVTNGNINVEGNKLQVKYDEEIIKEYDIVNIQSDKYDLEKEYIYTEIKDINLEDISITNGTLKENEETNELEIMYKEEVLDSYKLIKISSDVHNLEKEYIYTEIKDINLEDISITNGTLKENEETNELEIMYKEEVLDSYKLIKISSDVHNLKKEYIFEYSDNSISITNGTINENINNNTIEIKYKDKVIDTYKSSEAKSEKYDLSEDTIKVLDDLKEFKNNINCTNCEVKVYAGESEVNKEFTSNTNVLKIMYDEDVLKEYNLDFPVRDVKINSNDFKLGLERKTNKKLEIIINPIIADNQNITWESSNESVATVDENGLVTSVGLGTSTITVTTEDGGYADTVEVVVVETLYEIKYVAEEKEYIEYYIEDEDVKLKDDITKKGYALVGWLYNDIEYKLTDAFTMPAEDIELEAIWEIIIPDIEATSEYVLKDKLITGISLGTKVEDFDLGLDEIYTTKIVSNKEKELLGTGDKVQIYLGDTLVVEYVVVVKGDVSGDGKATVADYSKAYQYFKKRITMEECFVEATDVVTKDPEITMADVSKIYQFIKNRINTLD